MGEILKKNNWQDLVSGRVVGKELGAVRGAGGGGLVSKLIPVFELGQVGECY